jgi:uncharacterized protein (TIGR02147 family)
MESKGEKLSYSSLAAIANLGSRTKMKKILKGEMQMPKHSLTKLARYFSLDCHQVKYLETIRLLNLQTEPEAIICLHEKAMELKTKHDATYNQHKLSNLQVKLLKKWYYLPLLSYFKLESSSCDPAAIRNAFHGKITIEQITEAIDVLLELNLISINTDGELKTINDSVTLLDGIPRALIKKFHHDMIEKAKETIYNVPVDKRYLISTSLNIDESDLDLIQTKINSFFLGLEKEFSNKQGKLIHQMNLQLFNICKS